MKGAHTVGSWSAEDPDIASAEAAIRRMRAAFRAGAVRTSVLSLVVLAEDVTEAPAAVQATQDLADRVPGRVIVVTTLPHGDTGTNASVSVRTLERGAGPPSCVEQVHLEVRGDALHHLGSIVGPWILPGLPLAVWLPRRLPRPSEPLVSDADRVLIDTHRSTRPIDHADLLALSRLPTTDLAWVRLQPWRLLLADAFAGTERSPFLHGVERLDASGTRAWSALMAGWLMSRLALAPPAIRLIEADRAAVHIRARHDGRQATIAADAVDDQEVQVTTTVTNRPSRRRRLRLPTRSTAADLEAALTSRPGPDEICERATAGALLLLERR